MDEAHAERANVTPEGAGTVLRNAREASGLDLAEVAARTRIPLRHLQAIEAGDYSALPSPTYAVGFARAHARAVGADEVAIAGAVRSEVDRIGRRVPEYQPYETADPARVPSRGLTIAALGVALAVLVLLGLWYGTDWFDPAGGRAEQQTAAGPAPTVSAPVPQRTQAVPTGGQVRLTANDEVWLRVYDAANKTLFIGTMKSGDAFDVPPDADDPKINVGRPDKLAVTLNGAALPPLGTGERPIKDVRVSASAIAGRLAQAQPGAAASAMPAAGASVAE